MPKYTGTTGEALYRLALAHARGTATPWDIRTLAKESGRSADRKGESSTRKALHRWCSANNVAVPRLERTRTWVATVTTRSERLGIGVSVPGYVLDGAGLERGDTVLFTAGDGTVTITRTLPLKRGS